MLLKRGVPRNTPNLTGIVRRTVFRFAMHESLNVKGSLLFLFVLFFLFFLFFHHGEEN